MNYCTMNNLMVWEGLLLSSSPNNNFTFALSKHPSIRSDIKGLYAIHIYSIWTYSIHILYNEVLMRISKIHLDDPLIKHLICPDKIYRINYSLTDIGFLRLILISIFIKSDTIYLQQSNSGFFNINT